jgi:CheY-like chemotaxis protein
MNFLFKCILVIDDDEPTNFFTKIILEEYPCAQHVQIVQSGQEALDYLAAAMLIGDNENFPYPDLVLLDINMPAMNGWEFLEEFKKLSRPRDPKILMLTTSLFPGDKEKAAETPEIAGFENKPLTVEKLENIVRLHFTTVLSPGKVVHDANPQKGQAAA